MMRLRPMLPLSGVAALLDVTRKEATKLAESGKILWAFNLAPANSKRGGTSQRMDLRFLTEAVTDYMAGRKCGIDWADITGALSSGEYLGEIWVGEVARFLNLAPQDIVRQQCLDGVKISRKGKVGPNGEARFSLESFIDYLKKHRWP